MLRMLDHKNSASDFKRAKELRKEAPMPEKLLWNELRVAARHRGFKFRRQYPLQPYIADFICLKVKLVIELDGDTHAGREAYDRARDERMQSQGYTVLRFNNNDVMENLDNVLLVILEKAAELIAQNSSHSAQLSAPSPDPSREGRGSLD